MVLGSNANMSDISHRLIVISYNMHGFNQGRHGIIDLVSTLEPDAIMGQEGNWTTRGYANSRIAKSRTGHLADWSTRGLDNSRTGQLADWTTRGLADAAKQEN